MQWTCDLRKHIIGTHQFFFLRVILEVMLDLNYHFLRRPNKWLTQNPKIKILLRKQTLCFPRLSLRSSIRPFRPEMIPEIWKFQRFSLFLSILGKFYLSCLPRLVEKMWGVKEASLNVIIDIITVTIRILIIKITRPKPAYGRQGLDWIVGPGYSFVVFSTNKTMETNQKPW